MLSLKEYTATHRAKLARRLEKQGVRFISELSYDQYLRSALWKSIREWVIDTQAGKCSICNCKANEVHHHNYADETMWGEQSDGLVGLCARCHGLIEFEENHAKRDDLVEKKVVYGKLLGGFERLREEGFSLNISQAGLTTAVEYTGISDFQKFFECSSLAYNFVCSFAFKGLSFPLPFGGEKLTQKTGVKLSDRSTKKHIATVWADARSITLRRTKACTFPIEEHLRAFLHEQPYVSIAERA